MSLKKHYSYNSGASDSYRVHQGAIRRRVLILHEILSDGHDQSYSKKDSKATSHAGLLETALPVSDIFNKRIM